MRHPEIFEAGEAMRGQELSSYIGPVHLILDWVAPHQLRSSWLVRLLLFRYFAERPPQTYQTPRPKKSDSSELLSDSYTSCPPTKSVSLVLII